MFTKIYISKFRKTEFIDTPNERSSHKRPTPTSGGIVFSSVYLVSSTYFLNVAEYQIYQHLLILIPIYMLGVIGFIDDVKQISPLFRLFAHFALAIWCIYQLGGFPYLYFYGYEVNSIVLTSIFGVLFFVWLLNLYNFMDGIDGIASLETITACISIAVFLFLDNQQMDVWVLPLLLMSVVFGFLFLNFPKAKIFMGDAGSSFIGACLASMAIMHTKEDPDFFWIWVILLAVFITDSTLTLFHRTLKKEKIYIAHKSHLYQIAAEKYSSHSKVSLAVAFINIFWLFPMAYLVYANFIEGFIGMLVAYSPLIMFSIFFRNKYS
tara:strand:+ start:466 stop:1431 length:966 start_codon:yes stop_codon:yes gene_type:complete